MATVQLSDGAHDYAFTLEDLPPDADGYQLRIRSAQDTKAHALTIREDGTGAFLVSHGNSPQVRVRTSDEDGRTSRLRAAFVPDDEEDVAGHAAQQEAEFTGTIEDDDADDVIGHISIKGAYPRRPRPSR